MASSFYNSGIVFCLLFLYAYSEQLTCDDNIHVCLMKLLMKKSKIPVKLKVESGWEMMKISPNPEKTVNIVWRNWTIIDSLGDEYCLNNCMKKNDTREEAEDPLENEDRLSYCIKECSTKNYTVSYTTEKPYNEEQSVTEEEKYIYTTLKPEQEGEEEYEIEGSLGMVSEPENKTICINFALLENQLSNFKRIYYPQDVPLPYLCCNSDRHLKRVLDFFKYYRIYEQRNASPIDSLCFIEDIVPIMKVYQAVRRVPVGNGVKCLRCDDYNYLRKFVEWYRMVVARDNDELSAGKGGISRRIRLKPDNNRNVRPYYKPYSTPSPSFKRFRDNHYPFAVLGRGIFQ